MSFKCLAPRLAYQEYEGQKPIFLKMNTERDYEYYLKNLPKKYNLLLLPCGRCLNCLKKKAQEWTSRLVKETENYKYCYFITLTYNDENFHDLNKRDLQLFLKRYRKAFNLDCKYYITGEYGEVTKRPHYHAIFFQNKPIKDLVFYSNNLYTSEFFSNCWNKGNCLISKQVNESSIRYTVAYTLKKLGETKIVLMSKGLGLSYLKQNKEDIKNYEGFYVRNGYKQRLPFYFKRKLKESTDLADIEYLEAQENKFRASEKLTGSTIGDLLDELFKSSEKLDFKGKGEF